MGEYVVIRRDGTVSEQFSAHSADDAVEKAPCGGVLYTRIEYLGRGEPDWTTFKVVVEPLAYGYRVRLAAEGVEDEPLAYAHDLSTALEMALPAMRRLASPDPLFDAYRMPSAPDGPPETS